MAQTWHKIDFGSSPIDSCGWLNNRAIQRASPFGIQEGKAVPLQLIAAHVQQLILRPHEDRFLAPNQLRSKAEFATASHGTELRMYRVEAVSMRKQWDPERTAKIARNNSSARTQHPCTVR